MPFFSDENSSNAGYIEENVALFISCQSQKAFTVSPKALFLKHIQLKKNLILGSHGNLCGQPFFKII